jgi:hypothetical protein
VAAPAPWELHGWVSHTQLLLDSFRHWLARDLIPRSGSPLEQAKVLFEAPIVVVSHDARVDPLLTYANQAALDLWETDVETLLHTPSRMTAEADRREDRAKLLEQTRRNGFVEDYQGIRISTSGRRFHIEGAIVWNLVDAFGKPVGQAATFSKWHRLHS